MRNKAAAGAATILVCLNLTIAVLFACIARDWLFTQPQSYETLNRTTSVAAALEFIACGLLPVVPYLLWRSRGWGILSALVAGLFLVLHGILLAAQDLSISSVTSLAFAIASIASAVWYLRVLRSEKRQFENSYQDDGIDLQQQLKSVLQRMGNSHELSGIPSNLSRSFYVWTILALLAVIFAGVSIQETVFKRELSVEATAIISRVVTPDDIETAEEDFNTATQNLLNVTEFPTSQCESVSPKTVRKLGLTEGSALTVLVDPSSLECEVLAEPYPPYWVLSVLIPLTAFALAEATLAVERIRKLRSLSDLEYATPLFAVTQDGKQSSERLRSFVGRIVIETDSFVQLQSLPAAQTPPVRCVPMSQYSSREYGEGLRCGNSALESHRVLTVTRAKCIRNEHQDRTTNENDPEDRTHQTSSGLVDDRRSVSQRQDQQGEMPRNERPATVESKSRSQTRAASGPYYLVPGTYTLDRLLIVDPVAEEVLECRLLGGAVGDGFPVPDPFDLITLWN